MKRSILVVRALALVAACRTDARDSSATHETNANSGGVSLVTVTAGAADAGSVDNGQQISTDSAVTDAGITVAIAPTEPVDSGVSEPPIVTSRPARGLALVSAAQCSRRVPENAACSRLNEMCGGGQSHCLTSGNNRVPPRCSATQWSCRCQGTTIGLAWGCSVAMHPAGPLAPPELVA
ncbi:MAG: hypothetical protein JNK05_07075 [Myxococcales bacterium]|nr:hypothetical protein [Myxococcales bacterium]